MTFTNKPLATTAIAIDDATHAIRVHADDITLTATDIDLDAAAITGDPAKTLKDVNASVAAVTTALGTPAQTADISAAATAIIGTAGGKTLKDINTSVAATTAGLAALAQTGEALTAGAAVIAGIIGTSGAKTLKDINTTLGSPAQVTTVAAVTTAVGALQTAALVPLGNGDYVISAAAKATMSGVSAVLPTALNITLPAGLLRLIFSPGRNNTGPVYFAIGGVATSLSPEVPTASLPFTKTVADTVQILGTASDTLTVLVCVART